jgi:hypothetical protein
MNQIGGCEGLFLDSPLLNDGSINLPIVNSCVGIQNIILNEELKTQLFESMGIAQGQCRGNNDSCLYMLFNGEKFSDILEASYSERFMTGDIGPNVGFTHGAGIKCKSEVYEAFPALIRLREFLTKVEYHGEVLCNITPDFLMTNVWFGHCAWGFGMFSEICKSTTQDMLEFMFEKVDNCELYESICVSNLITNSPFPNRGLANRIIHAPKGAEKHLWRVPRLGGESIFITCHGSYLKEARKRIRRTIENLLGFDQELQYRIDYGLRMSFNMCKQEYKQFEEMSFTQPVKDLRSNPGVV